MSRLKDAPAQPPAAAPSPSSPASTSLLYAWLGAHGGMATPRGWGGGSSSVAALLIDHPRPHPITAQPLLSPPAWPACASLRPRGPGIRLESRFRECHLPPLMVLIIGTGWRGGGGGAEADSLLRLPPSAPQQAGGRPEPALGRRGRESSVMGWAACRCCCLLHQCRPGIGRQLKAWAVMGSEDAKSQEGDGGQMGSPSPWLCHTVPGESACFHPTSLPGTQSPCC